MVNDTRLLSKPIAGGIVVVCLLIAAMIAIQLMVGVITFDYYPIVILIAFIANIALLPPLLFLSTRVVTAKLPTLILLHISMGLMIVFFSQTYSPFTASWSILILVSSIYYQWKGFVASSIGLAIVGASYILLFPQNIGEPLNYMFLSVLVVALTVFSSFLFVQVIMLSRKQNQELAYAQKSERLQVNRQTTLLNSISDAVLTLNRYGRITSQNAAAQAFFDTNQSLIGRDLESLLQLRDQMDQPVRVHDLINSVKSTMLRDDLSIGEGGNTQHLNIQMSRIKSTFDDSEEYGVVVIIRDITKQKTLEEEKDEFISVMSHELRTPVAIAEGSLSNLLVMYDKHAEEKVLENAAKTAYDQVIYLARMVNDLSTLSRAERGVGDTIEEIDVNEMLHDLYNRYEPEAKQKSLRLDLDIDGALPHVETSRLYLEEIMQNFITNAIKYTNEGTITISARMQENGRIHCAVRDTGIGISKPDLEHIFEKFYRSEDYRTRVTSGTGLGLYVVRKLADKLETKIEVESRLNHGSTFGFVLPLKTTRKATDHTPVPARDK